jgi:hypothetical protein
MLGVCRSNALFEYVPKKEHVRECPFEITDDYAAKNYYVTPGCLVWSRLDPSSVGGSFYDPCRSGQCNSARVKLSLSSIVDDVDLKVPFDVRRLGSREPLGTWPIVFLSNNATTNDNHAELAALLREWNVLGRNGSVPWRIEEDFFDNVVAGGGKKNDGGVGNTPHGLNWGTAEGFANVSSQYCDAISDWWPEDWSKPVGYHVTLPCDGADSAYRTFDSAFFMEMDNTSEVFQVTMRYAHTALRNITAASNEYGRSGFCRRGVYGMPTLVTNTMRVCTQDATNVMYDAHVPVMPRWLGPANQAGDEHCSNSPYDIPWTIDDAGSNVMEPGMFSTGHLAHYSGTMQSDVQNKDYPDGLAIMSQYVHPGVSVHSWGDSCADGEFLECTADEHCVGLEDDVTMVCLRGVCVLHYQFHDSFTCYDHSDCSDQNKMCSGTPRSLCSLYALSITNRYLCSH